MKFLVDLFMALLVGAILFIAIFFTADLVRGDQFTCTQVGGTTICDDGTTVIDLGGTIIVNPGQEKERKKDHYYQERRPEMKTCVKSGTTTTCF